MNKINNLDLQEINKVIEVLTAYKEGKIVQFYTDKHGWVKCIAPPCISIVSTQFYRIVDEEENIETYEQ